MQWIVVNTDTTGQSVSLCGILSINEHLYYTLPPRLREYSRKEERNRKILRVRGCGGPR